MAGEWIKMRGNLWDDPRVGSMADACGVGEAAIIGALYWLWATADQHTEDGVMPGMSRRQIDRKTGVPGFGDALADVGWIADHPGGLLIVKFEEHNGASAKRRCMDAQRKANSRNVSASDADNTRTDDGQGAPESGRGAELEKRREEKSNTSSLRSEVVARASRLPEDWQAPSEWLDWALAERPDLDPAKTAEQFRDYWVAKPGKDGRKADWAATWRNWVRNQRQHSRAPPGQRQPTAAEARAMQAVPSIAAPHLRQQHSKTLPFVEEVSHEPSLPLG